MDKNYNVLAIDDSPDVLDSFELIIDYLKKVTFFKAINYRILKKIISENQIDLCFIDIVFPIKDGYEICKEIKEHPNTKDSFIYLMSCAKKETYNRIKAYKCGAHEFLNKPFDLKELELIVLSKKEFSDKRINNNSQKIGDFTLESKTNNIFLLDNLLDLTNLEYRCLKFMLSSESEIIEKQKLINYIWSNDITKDNNSLRVLIYSLRKKIELSNRSPDYIINKNKEYIFNSTLELGKS